MSKQVQDDNATIKENYNVEDNKQGDIVKLERKEMENLHDSLVQMGRENGQLKGTIREWIVKTEIGVMKSKRVKTGIRIFQRN